MVEIRGTIHGNTITLAHKPNLPPGSAVTVSITLTDPQPIIKAYTAGKISIGKAAQLMGVSHEEMKEIIVKNGGFLHLGPETMEELLQDIANV